MVDEKKKEIFSELDAFLEILDEDDRLKVPTKLRNLYKENRKKGYNPVYSRDIPINEQGIKKETITMIGLLHLNYWCRTEVEKEELRKIFKENETTHEKELFGKYNPNDIFREEPEIVENILEEESMVKYKEPFYIKIINFIKKLFKRK